jgi:hypothetical protein
MTHAADGPPAFTEKEMQSQLEHRAALIAALRSGSFQQCIGTHATPDGAYCAIGLGLHLMPNVLLEADGLMCRVYIDGERDHDVVPDAFLEYFGLTNEFWVNVWNANDVGGASFPALATLIEEASHA